MMQAARTERTRKLFQAVGMKGEFAKTAKRVMRETPEYERALKEGRARDWLAGEASSFAESAYELLLERLESLEQ